MEVGRRALTSDRTVHLTEVVTETRMAMRSGRHFLQIPGPTNVPDRILRAIDQPTIDHRGPDFAVLAREVLAGLKAVLKTAAEVVIYPASGTGAWEAAIANALSPGDRVLMFETGHFATLWRDVAERFGLSVAFVPGDWRRGADPATLERALAEDEGRSIKAVMVVHNETSTGCVSPILELRRAIDRTGHPALFMVDTISSLASIDYRHDEWGVDVTVGASQKGLMLPPGLTFNAISPKALAAAQASRMPRSYWDWQAVLLSNRAGFFPYTPPTNLLYGLREALQMLRDEGLDNVFARHARLAEATRQAVRAWGLEMVCADPAAYSDSLTAVMLPSGSDADALRRLILERYDISLGAGLGRLAGKVFRIGHLGALNEAMLLGTLAGIEMGLHVARVPCRPGGVAAAMEALTAEQR